ncbi:hypothetical protein HK102_007026 [Quaeritorhiza haematococci]|nr:hypothetical protein HK102_007026 [Quaeritorhiza haematococci]
MVRPGRNNVSSTYGSPAVLPPGVAEGKEDLHLTSPSGTARPITDDELVQILHARCSIDMPFTKVGDKAIVFVNPNKQLAKFSDSTSKDYAAHAKELPVVLLSEDAEAAKDPNKVSVVTGVGPVQKKQAVPPHVFELAASAYFHMVREREDQSIIMSGETGSGKTECAKLITRHLCDLSKSSKKKSRVHSAVLKVDSVVTAFGHAWTPMNRNASCVGRYTEYQFDGRGKMVGAKYIDCLLEKGRVVGAEDGGRSFNVFYQLLGGASQEEKGLWHISDRPDHFHYLSQSKIRTVTLEDGQNFATLRENMKTLGIGRRQQAQLFQLMAAILHLGNINFVDDPNDGNEACTVRNYAQLTLTADLLGLHPQTLENVLTSKTKLVRRDLISMFLDSDGAAEQRDALARTLYSVAFTWVMDQMNNKLCKDDGVWKTYLAILDLPGFAGRDNLTGNNFHRLMVNYANNRLHSFVNNLLYDGSVKDLYVSEGLEGPETNFPLGLDALYLLEGNPNAPNSNTDDKIESEKKKDSSSNLPLLSIIDIESSRSTKNSRITEKLYAAAQQSQHSSAFLPSKKPKYAFAIRHHLGTVEYDTHGLTEQNLDTLQSDFVTLIRGSPEQPGTNSGFLRVLFSDKLISTQSHVGDKSTVVAATRKLSRYPSMKRKNRKSKGGAEEEDHVEPVETVGSQLRGTVGEIFDTLSETKTWYLFALRPNDMPLPAASAGVPAPSQTISPETLKRQVTGFSLTSLSSNPTLLYTANPIHGDALKRYESVLPKEAKASLWPRGQCDELIGAMKWSARESVTGDTRFFLSESAWRTLEDLLRVREDTLSSSGSSNGDKEEGGKKKKKTSSDGRSVDGSDYTKKKNPGSPPSEAGTYYSEDDFDDTASYVSDAESHYSSEFDFANGPNRRYSRAMSSVSGVSGYRDIEMGKVKGGMGRLNSNGTLVDAKKGSDSGSTEGKKDGEVVEGKDGKKKGLFKKKSKKPKEPISKARWRWLCCVWASTWWVPPFCLSICGGMKRRDRQLAWREKVTLCIIIFLMCAFILFFIAGLGWVICPRKPELSPNEVGGRNDPNRRPTVFMYGNYYQIDDVIRTHGQHGVTENQWRQTTLGQDVSQMFSKEPFWSSYCPAYQKPGLFRLFVQDDRRFVDGSWALHNVPGKDDYIPKLRNQRKGTVVWNVETMRNFIQIGPTYRLLVAYDRIYDISPFFTDSYKDQTIFLGTSPAVKTFLRNLFDQFGDKPGADVTDQMNRIRSEARREWEEILTCMNGLFYVGNVDHRNDVQCVFPNYILLVASAVLVAVIGFKFIAALQLGSRRDPEDHDKFVICQVPCYTEGETSLTKTLQSLAVLDYDDKHKLLFVVADGMIIGTGNDRPTPRIVLDILGVDPSVDPAPLSFQSLGEGNKQHNMGKVYSGLYETQGHVVPFIVVVKVGKPSERNRPGNRGKRDSQMVLMRFLSRVHFNQPMSPLELEMYHHMKNIIGVDPAFYEYVFMVDADTEVIPDSLNRLVSCCARDSKIMGICGETMISNERTSWVTMIQVYEYFISHHLAKAFESLFGSVTCLPGCFCMYRIRTPIKNVPLLVAPGVINDYSENSVNTLHLKNLLHLGEDRYLTTLMMKHFPNMKMTFTADAKAKTGAPDKWSVLLSQRRRWINSTVHNLLELLFLPELCGFCCFSMRFVVFIDLFATVIQPASLVYILYLVVLTSIDDTSQFPLISIVMIAAVYGFQVIIFLLKREWQHIGWMIIYILAIPVFGFYIPIYSFWHFDDFSWGNTRRVVGENAKTAYVMDVEPYDPSSIPVKTWAEYEQDLLERQETMSYRSGGSRAGLTHDNASIRSGRQSKRGPPSLYNGSQYGGDRGSVYGGSMYGDGSVVYAPPPAAGMMVPPPPPSAYGGGSLYNAMSPFLPPAGAPGTAGPPSAYGALPPATGADPRASFYSAVSIPQQRGSWGSPPTGFMPGFDPVTGRPLSGVSQGSATMPTDEAILEEVRHILSTADLMTVTKKSVREELSRFFGVDLTPKKEYIHKCIDGVLKGEL